MATAGTASEAEEAFTGVIRRDQPASMTGEAADLPPEETDHGEATAEQGHATPVAEVPVAIDAPSLVPSIESPAHPDATPDPDEIENFAARRKRLQARRKEARRSSRWTALILVLFAFNVALVGARSEVVRFFPQTASLFAAFGLPVNLRNPKFENMRISKEIQEGLSHSSSKAPFSASVTDHLRCRGCALRHAIPPGRKFTPGPQCRGAASLAPEKNLISAAASFRRPTMRSM
jgi:hypothetical protein